MGGLSIWHWLIVLAVVVLIFGTKKLPHLGSDLGNAIKGFKKAMHNESAPKDGTENTDSAKNISSPVVKKTGKKSSKPKSSQRTKTSKKLSSTSSGKRDV